MPPTPKMKLVGKYWMQLLGVSMLSVSWRQSSLVFLFQTKDACEQIIVRNSNIATDLIGFKVMEFILAMIPGEQNLAKNMIHTDFGWQTNRFVMLMDLGAGKQF